MATEEEDFAVHGDEGTEEAPLRLVTHPQNLLLAAAAGGSEELLVAALAVHMAFLLHKPVLCQGGVAVSTGELLGVPRHAHGHEERAPGDKKEEIQTS